MAIGATKTAIGFNKKTSGGSSSLTWSQLSDGTTSIRRYILNGYCLTDKTLTPTGFAGTENTDWANIDSFYVGH